MKNVQDKLVGGGLCIAFLVLIFIGVKATDATNGDSNRITMTEVASHSPSTLTPEVEESMRAYNQKIMESIKAIENESTVENDLVESKTVNGYLLWEERFMEVGDSHILEIEDDSKLKEAGLQDEDVYSITNSLSYYCMKNGIAVQPVVVNSCVEENGLYLTQVNVGVTRLEQVYEKETQMQRVNYVEGNDVMDTFGVLAVDMDDVDRERYTNTLLSYVEEGTLYSVKELNCCWYYLYVTGNGDNMYIRVSKNDREVIERGRFNEKGLVRGEAETVGSPTTEEQSEAVFNTENMTGTEIVPIESNDGEEISNNE